MFQPEPISHPEARADLPEIAKLLKMRRLRQPLFGVCPASSNSSDKERDRESQEIQANKGPHRTARSIRQTTPTKSSSSN
jgi:hypothetical protein